MLPTTYIPVFSPESFTISAKAYTDFIQENNLHTKIVHLLGTITNEDNRSKERAAGHIKKYILESPFPGAFISDVFQAYSLLGGVMKDAYVVLQSKEDFQKSQPLQGEATLLVAVKEIWASHCALLVSRPTNTKLLESGIEIVVEKADKKNARKEVTITEKLPVTALLPTRFTATRIYLDHIQSSLADVVAKRQVDGIVFRIKLANSTHPKHAIRIGKRQAYIEKLAEDIARIVRPFSPRPIVYQTSDFTTSEYRTLEGGYAFEPVEINPLLGYRGTFRSVHDPELFSIELDAIKMVRSMGLKNLWIMLPFVRSVEELIEAKKLIITAGLYRCANFKVWMTVEIPSNVILLDKFIEAGIDGISIDFVDLAMFILGTDRNNPELEKTSNEQDEAVLWAIEKAIKTAHKYHITSSLHGKSSPLQQDFLEKLIRWGITSVCVAPDAIEITRERIAEIEKRLVS